MRRFFIPAIWVSIFTSISANALAPLGEQCDFTGTHVVGMGVNNKPLDVRIVQIGQTVTGEVNFTDPNGTLKKYLPTGVYIILGTGILVVDEDGSKNCRLDGELSYRSDENVKLQIEMSTNHLEAHDALNHHTHINIISELNGGHETHMSFLGARYTFESPSLQWATLPTPPTCPNLTGKYYLQSDKINPTKPAGKLRIIQLEDVVFGEFSWANTHWRKPNRIFTAKLIDDISGQCKISGQQKIAQREGPRRDLHIIPNSGSDSLTLSLDVAATGQDTTSLITLTANKILGQPKFYWMTPPSKADVMRKNDSTAPKALKIKTQK